MSKLVATSTRLPANGPADSPVWFVGEQPGVNTLAGFDLYPYPPSSAGGRLWALTGYGLGTYLKKVHRQNLVYEYTPTWPRELAAALAAELRPTLAGKTVFLFGVKVTRAFGFRPTAPSEHVLEGCNTHFVLLPHPSGRCRQWNDPTVREFAKARFMAASLRLIV